MAKKNSSTIIAVAVVLTMSCCCCSSLVMFKGKYKEDKELSEPPTNTVATEVTTATETEPIATYTIKGYEMDEYSRKIVLNSDTDCAVSYTLNKLPIGTYKARMSEEESYGDFEIIKDCLKVDYNYPYPESFNKVEEFNFSEYGTKEAEFTLHGDESIHITCDKTFVFELISPLEEENIYYLFSGETGEYGRIVTLNATTDLPVDKYLYKIPSGKYTISTTFDKLTSAWIVKDEITTEDNPDYPEVLQYVGEALQLTAGDNDFNGNAKKEIDIEIAEDESILIPNNDKGTEFILKRKE